MPNHPNRRTDFKRRLLANSNRRVLMRLVLRDISMHEDISGPTCHHYALWDSRISASDPQNLQCGKSALSVSTTPPSKRRQTFGLCFAAKPGKNDGSCLFTAADQCLFFFNKSGITGGTNWDGSGQPQGISVSR